MSPSLSDSDSLSTIRDGYVYRNVVGGLEAIFSDRSTAAYFVILVTILFLGLIGPELAPYQFDETQYAADGTIKRLEGPSMVHPLGTTDVGYDVLSRILVGARPTVITGLLGGSMIIGIGMTVGVTAGYVGGTVENVLMRLTDFVYGVPLIPFAIVLVALFSVGFIESIVVIGLILWRGNARVLRSQVLQIRERPFIMAAKSTGASTPRILLKHVLPNVASMAILFFALGVGYTILIQAGLAFLGVSDPAVPAWGIMVRNAYNSGYVSIAWWWSIPPGILISMTVLSTFMFGRSYETVAETDEEAMVEMG